MFMQFTDKIAGSDKAVRSDKKPSQNQANPWTLIEGRPVYDCEFYTARSDLVKHRSGNPRAYSSIHFKHFGAAVVPIDHDGSTVLVGQYRLVPDRFTWEVPRGGGTRGRVPAEVARTELLEETGLTAHNWLQVFRLWVSPGTTDEWAPGFVAWSLSQGEPHPEPEEEISLWRLPFAKAVEMAISGEIDDMGSVSLLLCVHARLLRGDLPNELLEALRR